MLFGMKYAFFLLAIAALDAKDTLMEDHMSSQTDVCNLGRIYNESYQYSLPPKVLESFLSGKAFDHPEVYTGEENELYQSIVVTHPARENLAIITAGAPGAGKTVKLRQDLEANASKGRHYAYICPDDVCLKNQTRTYVADRGESMAVRQHAYTKWRPGSNAAAHLILGNLIREKYAFYFGSTPDDVRWGSIQERDKTFVQTTEQDVQEKGLLLPQRISDTFLKYADQIEFYYRGDVQQDAVLAARWLRNRDVSEFSGTLQILEPQQYEQIKSVHDAAVGVLQKPELLWQNVVESKSKILAMTI